MRNGFLTARSAGTILRWRPAAIVTLGATAALMMLTAAPPADAAKRTRPARPTEATAPRAAGEPIMAIVSIKSQKVTFYDADGWILRAPVSTGTTGRETPVGRAVIARGRASPTPERHGYPNASWPASRLVGPRRR